MNDLEDKLEEACKKMEQDFVNDIVQMIKEVKANSVGIYSDEDVKEFENLSMDEYIKFLNTGEGNIPRILREMEKS